MPDIDWSNPTIQGVLIAGLIGLTGVVIAAIAGVLGARAGARIGADAAREAARLAKEQAEADRHDARVARDADRELAYRDRFAERTLALAVDLLLAADLHRREADQQIAERWQRFEDDVNYGSEAATTEPLPSVGPTEPVRAAYLALDLVAPALAEPAAELYRATVPLGALAATWPHPTRDDDAKRWAREWAEATNRWDTARVAFVDATRGDLAVMPESSA